tara:strand:+ start:697 stop:1833 length:1137 start_codon:yes stop_codon:yes gene_type:complete
MLKYRRYDLINKNSKKELLYKFKNFPVFMGCSTEKSEKDLFSNLNVWIGKKTGFIQINPYVDLKVVYKKAHGSGTVGNLWNNHHIEFAEFISQYSPNKVLEIGGSHGILAKNFIKKQKVEWSIIEPNPFRKQKKIKYIKKFFDAKFVSKNKNKYDSIVHSHVFEHVPNPNTFIKLINRILEENGKMFFSIPNLNLWLKNKNLSTINFEHTFFLSTPYVDYVLKKNNFKIIKKKYFNKDHSIFYSCIKKNNIKKIKLDGKKYYKQNKLNFYKFINYYKKTIHYYNKKILNENSEIFIFGAHVFTQFLLNFGLNKEKIICILDNDTSKQNKRLYGTNISVKSPKILTEFSKPIVILKAGVYSQEIKENIINHINKKTIFI